MVVGPSTSQGGKRILYYRCDNQDCKWRKDKTITPRNLRGKVILDFLYEFFPKDFKLTEEDYKRYYMKLDILTAERRVKLKTQIRSSQGSATALEEDIWASSLKIADLNLQGTAKAVNEQKIAEEVAEKNEIEADVEKLKALLTDPDKDRLTLEQFLNLSKKAETIIKSADAIKKDAIVRLIFLNLDVDNQKVALYRLKEPFETLLKQRQVLSSRDGET